MGRPYSWSLDRYGSGRSTFTLSLGADGALVLEERDQDLGGNESSYRSSVDEAEALRRLVLGC